MRIALPLLSLLLVLAPAFGADDWEEVSRYDNLTLFRKEIPGNPVLAYRIAGSVNAPIAKLVTVITDTPRKREWMNRIQEARVLHEYGPADRLEYIHVHCPWPVKDRDFVYRTGVELDRERHRIVIRYASVDDPKWPEVSENVRAFVFFGTFALTPSADGKSTLVEAETHTDPRGAIPKWIVNLYQKKIARQSLDGMLQQVAKPGIADAPVALQLLASEAAPAPSPAPSPL